MKNEGQPGRRRPVNRHPGNTPASTDNKTSADRKGKSGKTACGSLAEQRALLQLEYEEEKRAFSRLTDRVGIERLQERGNAWFPIRIGATRYNSLNQRVVEIYRLNSSSGQDREEEEMDGLNHNFEYGKAVAFFTCGEESDKPKMRFTGTVSYVDGDRMVIAIPDSAQLSDLEGVRSGVTLSFDETTYRAMMNALDYTMNAKGRLGYLRDLFYNPQQKTERLNFEPLGFRYLNPVQENAVNEVLRAKDVAVVHGPPGTGKTTTLVEAIYETLRREKQVLVCAQSNMAVDWICEKLVDRGLHVLRIGNPTRVNDKMLSYTYERRFADHPDYPDLWKLRKSIRELQQAKKRPESWHQKMDRLRSRATELEIRINAELFNSAHVIASTLVGSASRQLEGMKFSTLFIDEAAQALEAAAWIPIRRAGRVVLAGDHCQLSPTVKSYEAMRRGLGYSLMERIVDTHPEAVSLLTTQYRMNSRIMGFSSRWFYGGRMTADPAVAFRQILERDDAVEWLDTSMVKLEQETADPAAVDSDAYEESLAGENFGRVNKDEAILTLLTLQNYINRIGKERFMEERYDVGIISPYRAQVQYMRKLLKCVSYFRPLRKQITVATVDGFQGQERDIIVLSMVRSNARGEIGFLRDLRRMNVAMTRARMKLLIIGNAPTLSRHPFYRALLRYIDPELTAQTDKAASKSGQEELLTQPGQEELLNTSDCQHPSQPE